MDFYKKTIFTVLIIIFTFAVTPVTINRKAIK